MSERIDASEELGHLLAGLRRLRDDWRASPDTLLRLGAGRLDAPIDTLSELDELLRRSARVLGGD